MPRSWWIGIAVTLIATGLSWSEEALIIAPRSGEPAEPAAARESIDELTAQIRVLGGDDAQQAQRQQALTVVMRSMNRAGDQLVNRADSNRFDDWVVRRGALRGIQALGVSGPRVSSTMAWAAARDPEPKVRDEAVGVIKARGDRMAAGLITRHLVDAFDKRGNVLKADVRDNAVQALRRIGDRRTAEALAKYVFAEVRTAVVQDNGMRTTRMRAPVPLPGGEGATFLDMPIEFPSLNVTRYRGTVVVPALAALRSLTGQDFGGNREQWTRWIRTHPPGDWK